MCLELLVLLLIEARVKNHLEDILGRIMKKTADV